MRPFMKLYAVKILDIIEEKLVKLKMIIMGYG